MTKFLQVFKSRRIAVTMVLGFASGLPLPLTTGTLDAWMASDKVDLKTIGIFSLVGLPYTLKFLWAPLLDRYTPPFLNRRTGWMIITQVLLMVFIAVMGFCDPLHAPLSMAALALTVAFLSATQDIVIDAYRTDLLSEREMGAGAAVSVTGARIALLSSGAVALILSDHMPWSTVYLIMAGLMGIGVITALIAPTPEIQVKPPRSLREAVIQPFLSYFQRKGAVQILLFILLFKLGDVMCGKMITPFLIRTGFTKTDIGTVNKGFGMIVTIVGSLFGGGMVARIGIGSSLWLFGILQAVSNLSFVLLAYLGKSYPMMIAAIGIENVCSGMGTAAFVAFLMSLCDRHFTATQYALLTSLMAITRISMGPVSGYLAANLAWPWFFFVCTLFAIPGLLLLARFKPLLAGGQVTVVEAK